MLNILPEDSQSTALARRAEALEAHVVGRLNHTHEATLIILTMLASLLAASANNRSLLTTWKTALHAKYYLFPNGKWRYCADLAHKSIIRLYQGRAFRPHHEFIPRLHDRFRSGRVHSECPGAGERYRGRIFMNHPSRCRFVC